MTLPLTLGLLAAWFIVPALVIVALKGRTLFGDPSARERMDDLLDEHAENLGIGGRADFFQHGGSLTALGDNDHA